MSSYVEKVLQPGESVTYKGTIHWLIYLPSIVFALVAVVCVGLSTSSTTGDVSNIAWLASGLAGVCAVVSFTRAWFRRFTTEIAATNLRIIFKHGFISRQTVEMNMSKVESVDVTQSILGRMFDYGDILVRGTGTGLEPLSMIAHPLAFRNAVIAR
jgi:uncharacterized membrane protein YdbT with pleckstrin-like domain